MSQRFYAAVRGLHLYLGLFLSPFVVVFAVSVVFLVHAWVPGAGAAAEKRTVTDLPLPSDFEQLKGREQLAAAHTVLDRLGVQGDIGGVRQIPRERRFVYTVGLPGREASVDLNVATRTAAITTRRTGVWDATVYLHKMPGPHNVSVRVNTTFMLVWRWLADATVYLLLFLTVSGIYLWAVLKNERRVGLVLLAAGALSFGGIVYALVA